MKWSRYSSTDNDYNYNKNNNIKNDVFKTVWFYDIEDSIIEVIKCYLKTLQQDYGQYSVVMWASSMNAIKYLK